MPLPSEGKAGMMRLCAGILFFFPCACRLRNGEAVRSVQCSLRFTSLGDGGQAIPVLSVPHNRDRLRFYVALFPLAVLRIGDMRTAILLVGPTSIDTPSSLRNHSGPHTFTLLWKIHVYPHTRDGSINHTDLFPPPVTFLPLLQSTEPVKKRLGSGSKRQIRRLAMCGAGMSKLA
jgi:hypothetical protein